MLFGQGKYFDSKFHLSVIFVNIFLFSADIYLIIWRLSPLAVVRRDRIATRSGPERTGLIDPDWMLPAAETDCGKLHEFPSWPPR